MASPVFPAVHRPCPTCGRKIPSAGGKRIGGAKFAMVGLCLLVGVFELGSDGHSCSNIGFSIGSVVVVEVKMRVRGLRGLGGIV